MVDTDTYDSGRRAIKAFYAAIKDPTERLVMAAYEMDVDIAVEAIAQGADVNGEHSATGMRVVHLAASAGLRKLVDALLATGKCDLTIRDSMARLPSDCAAYSARDPELAELLAVEEGRQFRGTGKDPRLAAQKQNTHVRCQ